MSLLLIRPSNPLVLNSPPPWLWSICLAASIASVCVACLELARSASLRLFTQVSPSLYTVRSRPLLMKFSFCKSEKLITSARNSSSHSSNSNTCHPVAPCKTAHRDSYCVADVLLGVANSSPYGRFSDNEHTFLLPLIVPPLHRNLPPTP